MNITLTIVKNVYEKREHSTVTGYAVSAKYKVEGSTADYSAGSKRRAPVAAILDDGLAHILDRVASDYETAAVKVVLPAGYTAAQMQATVDKYSPEEQFTSITFA